MPAVAWDEFLVEDIEVQGAERIAIGTVLNYLPVRAGEMFGPTEARRAVRALYDTDLFDDVRMERDGDVLVVTVRERPAIGEINIEGSFRMGEDDLLRGLEGIGFARGRVFNEALLDQAEQEIQRMLLAEGKYGMELSTEVRELERNRVAVDITLNEGKTAKIRQIHIIGNESFDDRTLKDLMESGIPGRLNILSRADEYSREKLEGDLEAIRSHYLDRGYAEFSITSTQVTITPDKKDIYITINLDEGEQFRVRSVSLEGEFPVPREELEAQIRIEPGDLLSRRQITRTQDGISNWLAASGYAFARINVAPELDDETNEVDLTFFVDPGSRVHVRRIGFSGHTETRDEVFRREMRQMEGAQYSPQNIDRSRVRLQRLPQVAQVEVDTQRVAGVHDQVDIDFHIMEQPTGQLSIGAGYDSSQGVVFTLGLEQQNLLGTGKELRLTLDNAEATQSAEIRYRNPYYTEHGVSRTLRARYQESDPSRISGLARFFTDSALVGVNWGIPLSEFNRMTLGVAAEQTTIRTTDRSPPEIVDFIELEGEEFNAGELTIGFRRDTRNRTVFPDQGVRNDIFIDYAVPQSDLTYYKLTHTLDSYYPLFGSVVGSVSTNIGYGDGYGDQESLPFFKRFFAGGIRSVRGYGTRSLGPRFSDGSIAGGDFRTTGSLELSFPPPWAPDTRALRLSTFYDFGNVFADVDDFEASELRTSAGVSLNWRSPIGPMSFSFAQPLNDKSGDRTERFQFTIGTLF